MRERERVRERESQRVRERERARERARESERVREREGERVIWRCLSWTGPVSGVWNRPSPETETSSAFGNGYTSAVHGDRNHMYYNGSDK